MKAVCTLKDDYTGQTILENQATVLTASGISQLQKSTQEFFPKSQTIDVVEAYVLHSDGTKIMVEPDNIFTRPSAESQDAPGFTSSLTTTVVFPQLRLGSQTYIKWKLKQLKPSVLGFDQIISPPFESGIKNLEVLFILPKTLKLAWKERGGFIVQDTIQDSMRHIHAKIKNVPPQTSQVDMASSLGFSPIFVISAIPSWEELGARLYQESINTDDLTSQIQELSQKIVQDKTGKEAAEAIYNWVAENIQYVAVYLNAQEGYIAHRAEEILKNGYGDCKDHVTLMQALLKAQNIESYGVLVNWGNLYTPLPLPAAEQFDHEMIYLPEYDLFANPTDSKASFGILGEGLDGKFVVIATPEGKTAYLPTPTPQESVYKNTNTLSLLSDGTIKGKNIITTTGFANDAMRQGFSNTSLEAMSEKLMSETEMGGYGNFTLSGPPADLSKPFIISGEWTSPEAFSMDKSVYFQIPIGLNPLNQQQIDRAITPHTRKYPFITFPLQYTCTYTFEIPEGYALTHLPSNITLDTPEGSYKSSSVKKGEKNLFVERTLIINKPYLSAEEYESLRSVFYKFRNDARSIFVMTRK
ncbi:MAG: hypothetical protein B7Y25_06105 [Alphaproteobacteria bacterium 16-39-46]|nr:MAG: hypothetical protein B7Y25_06105 [Alphaproteobacteria bacterium 16-39-46]HQS84464.1 DUF3857 domain-containing protein [Alphaproteobacteria bacterium]HQS94804.1 DUF3857 domain-containing protein [Alphaproteobacteria bacterium]